MTNERDNAVEPSIGLPDGVTHIETVERDGDELVIPYSKYVLDNGLTVILHEDHSDPLTYVNLTYHVGSAREEFGRSGFAHFFEHMMFQGSENVADEKHFEIISEAGGSSNASTNRDLTDYYAEVPSNHLETILWLEADRMGFLLPAVTQEKFEIQRDTVKNERGQRVDNVPYGRVYERMAEAMYPVGHPYSWSVIGIMEDLDRANLDDLKRFFLKWYGPNNAVLAIGGDIDPEQTLAWIEKYFGAIPSGPNIEKATPVEISLDTDRYISMEDNVSKSHIRMAFPTVYRYHPDEAALSVLVRLLVQGSNAILYKNLVREQTAVSVTGGADCGELGCTMILGAYANDRKNVSLTELEEKIRESIAEIETRGVLPDDLARVKGQMRSSYIYVLETVTGKMNRLIDYETFQDNPNGLAADLGRYDAVTADDVMRVYREYIKDKPAVIMSVVPEGKGDEIARPDTWTPPQRVIPDRIGDETLALRPVQDDFDRSVAPQPSGDTPSFKMPTVNRQKLDNGLVLASARTDEMPTTTVHFLIEAGQRQERMDQLGLAGLTVRMLNESSALSSVEDIDNRLAKLGATLNIAAGQKYTVVFLRTLTENLDEALAIAEERLFSPGFKEDEFVRVLSQAKSRIDVDKKSASRLASLAFDRVVYGHDKTFSHRIHGTDETLSELTLDDVKAFYNAHFAKPRGSVSIVSNLDNKTLATKMSGFGEWSTGADDVNWRPEFPAPSNNIYIVDKPGAAQSEIRIGALSLPYDATGDHYRSTIMNIPLGGDFNSRINLNLREDKGFTYGARSGFKGEDKYGEFGAVAAVRSETTRAAIEEFLAEITAYAESGPTDTEWEYTKKKRTQEIATDYESPMQKVFLLREILEYDLSSDFVEEQQSVIRSMTRDEAAVLATQLLSPEEMSIIVVGDKASLLPELRTLGRDIIELDTDGSIVGPL